MKTKFNKTYFLKLTSKSDIIKADIIKADIIKAYIIKSDIIKAITSQTVKIATFIVLRV